MIQKLRTIFSKAQMLIGWSKKSKAAVELAEIVYERLKTEKGVHVETAITAVGAVGGSAILKATGLDFSEMKPGTPVLVQGIEAKVIPALDVMRKFCVIHHLNSETGWTTEIPEAHAAQKPLIDLISEFSRPFELICDNRNIPQAEWPEVAAIAAIKIIKQGEQVLSTDIGKAIAVQSFVFASKSAPPVSGNVAA